MRILGIDAALACCSVALLVDGATVALRQAEAGRGQHHLLPRLAADLLAGTAAPDAVAVSIGPGSVTGLRASDITDVIAPGFPVALCGDAAPALAAWLASWGANVMLTSARHPNAVSVAHVGAKRLVGALPPCEAQPLYVDPPEAKLPQGGLRPPPAG